MKKGTHHKESSKTKNSITNINLYKLEGRIPWNKDTKGVMPIPWNKNKKFLAITNERNPNWKGDNATYQAKHIWIYGKLGKPNTCKKCGKTNLKGKQIHWANISGMYKRELSDWIRLCAKCHWHYDKKVIPYWGINKDKADNLLLMLN